MVEFVTNTTPLSEALNLGVLKANVSNAFRPSFLALVRMYDTKMTINLSAACLLSKITVPGKASGLSSDKEYEDIFVDCVLLRDIINTFDTSTIVMKISEDGLLLKSGRSEFTLSRVIEDEVDIEDPVEDISNLESMELGVDSWKFIKENQMYAISINFAHPVYNYVWVGEYGDVIAGDFDDSLFTHSKESDLGVTCLLTDTIVNFLSSLPEGTTIAYDDDSYIVDITSEGYKLVTQFTPKYEDDKIGSYESDIILEVLKHSEECIQINCKSINRFLSQVSLLLSKDDTITVSYDNGKLQFSGYNTDFSIDVEGGCNPFKLDFKLFNIKNVFSKYTEDSISLCPIFTEGETVGITIWSEYLTTSIAGVD